MRVIGLDLSLTSTGLSDGQSRHAIQTSPSERIEARLGRIAQGVVSFALSPTQWTDSQPAGTVADLAVIEGSSYGSRGPGHEELAALRLMVRWRLWRLGVPFAIVPPTTLKKFVTGDGRATKQDMVAALDARYGAVLASVKVKDGRYDQADALGLASMGYAHVGLPLPVDTSGDGTYPRRSALASVDWPSLVSD